MSDRPSSALVIGAGLSGLLAAARLRDAGLSVTVLDKGRGVGGRLATRRIAVSEGQGSDGQRSDGPAVLDHGAQFFTVRSPAFADLVEGWPVHVWHHGPATAQSILDAPGTVVPGDADGHPRYCADAGMTAIAKHLAAELVASGAVVHTGVRALHARPAGDAWAVTTVDGDVHTADALVVTAPLPQTIELLDQTVLPAEITDRASYEPCLALLAVLDRSPTFTAVQFSDGPVNHIAENASKGISAQPAVTVHATGPWSADRFEADDADVAAQLTDLVTPWLDDARIVEHQVKRWRYATPLDPHPARAVQVADGLVLAGDVFGGPKVEGAALSGLAAADLLLG